MIKDYFTLSPCYPLCPLLYALCFVQFIMHIGRTLPPAASPIYPRDILSGIKRGFSGKKELNRFESELKEYFGVKHCFLVSSGKAALTLILQALKDMHPERNEVLIPAFTCYSVPSAIVRAGLKVRLCDIKPDTIDFDQLDKILAQSKLSIQNPWPRPQGGTHQGRPKSKMGIASWPSSPPTSSVFLPMLVESATWLMIQK